ncbi:MAG: DUF2007 domain-containing protein [Anaerolineae bacterium]|nr:DUF2007 domain-containing protein [Anaerolineae bacterium]
MSHPLSNVWPWFGGRRAEQAKSSETTPGGSEVTAWVVVAVNLNPAEAAIIKGRLESEAIPALVQQEAVGIMLGLTVGPMGSARVLVPEPLAERARGILAETFEVEDDQVWDETDQAEGEG